MKKLPSELHNLLTSHNREDIELGANILFKHYPQYIDEAISYQYWVSSLHKTGFPKHPSGAEMNSWELYEYWQSNLVNRDVLYNHVNKRIAEYESEKQKAAIKNLNL